MSENTCFVISPIGHKESDERKNADDLFDLVIEPAMEKFGFNVTRADKITSVSSITSDIIQMVQNSDLCIIDLTGNNANVMYECGRRHETGKHYIMMAKEGEKLPFDITTIRTIFYDLSNGRKIRESIKDIQKIVDTLMIDNFSVRGSGESLSTISDTLNRIERKLDSISTPLKKTSGSNDTSPTLTKLLKSLTPHQAFIFAIQREDIALAEAVLPKLKNTDIESFLNDYVIPLGFRGSAVAEDILENNFDEFYNFPNDLLKRCIASLASCYGRNLPDIRKSQRLKEFVDELLLKDNISNIDKAFFLNQYVKTLRNEEESIKILEKVIKLDPSNPSFYFNIAYEYYNLSDLDKAEEYIDVCIGMANEENEDDDHLYLAVRIFLAKEEIQKAKSAYTRLKRINHLKAALFDGNDKWGILLNE